jgi:hypothetical protein
VHAYELLKRKVPNKINHINELNELINASYNSNSIKYEKVTDHPLFDLINGLPLSIILLSSLRVDMSLAEIYDLLKNIQHNQDIIDQNSEDLSAILSIEASLMFITKINPHSMGPLACFALCQNGILEKDCLKLWDKKWNELKNLFIEKSIIESKRTILNKKSENVY